MTAAQFNRLLETNKLELKEDSIMIFDLLSILSELECNSFIYKNSLQDAAQSMDNLDISSDHQKEAA